VSATRADVERLIAAGEARAAARALAQLFAAQPTAANAAYVIASFDRLEDGLALVPLRVRILRSFTIEPLIPLLRARAFLAGICLDVSVGPYGVIDQILLGRDADDSSSADLVIVAALLDDVAPALWNGEPDVAAEVDAVAARVDGWMTAHRRASTATLVVQNFETPGRPSAGSVLEAQSEHSQTDLIAALNRRVRTSAQSLSSIHVFDIDALAARFGRERFRDARKHLAMRVPFSADGFSALADEYLRFLVVRAGLTCKVVAVDLDNTLWGGVLGEDGAEGLQMGVEYPGSAYRAVQRELRHLARRGILLAVCSKNDAEDARRVLTSHSDMLLRPDEFATLQINWDDKAQNLRRIAAALNIGLDAIAFVDDNPVERAWVEAQLPEVRVVGLPDDPSGFADALRRSPWFDRFSTSDDDRVRAAQYQSQRARTVAAAAADSPDAFLASLDMHASIADVRPLTLQRAAQLTQKTNQFNLTTRRYTDAELERRLSEPGIFARTIRVVDRFGDNGIVGLVIGQVCGARAEIDTFLLSCRVIGRDVETALLADAAAEARTRGARVIAGRFLATAKNAPARSFFARHGFALAGGDDAESVWERDLTGGGLDPPPWIACRVEEARS
jgi:FkbH-like protein